MPTAAAPSRRRRPQVRAAARRGFTLVELMIALVVVAILVALAMPSYTEYLARAHRADARTALVAAAQWTERFRGENNGSYAGATLPVGMRTVATRGGPAVYEVTLGNLTATTYVVTVAPAAGGRMAPDACGAFTVDQTGRRTAAGVDSGALFERCFGR